VSWATRIRNGLRGLLQGIRASNDDSVWVDPKLLQLLGIEMADINLRGPGALREATVYACVKILSEAVGKLPIKTMQDGTDGSRKATEHPNWRVLKTQPNPYMTASDFWRTTEAQRNLCGNAYAHIEYWPRGPNRGQVKALWPIDPQYVTMWVDDKGILDSHSRIWYIVRVGGEERRIEPPDMLHFKAVSLDGLIGITPIDYLRHLVEAGSSGTRYLRDFFKQGLTAKGLIQYTGDLNAAAEKTFRERFEQMSSGVKNNHRVALMPLGYQFTPLAHNMVDAQFLETTKLTVRQIATAFGVKMHQLNDLERATHTNIEEQQKDFYTDTLLAILTGYEQELTGKMFLTSEQESGYYVKFNVDVILRSKLMERYNAYRVGIAGGFIKPNEARALEELPPDPNGNELIVNGASKTLAAVLRGEATGKNATETE
jgi:HK97 family phage portal protein